GPQHLLDRVRHVLRHLQLVVPEDVVEAENGDTPCVFEAWIERDAGVRAREDLTKAAEADKGGIVLADVRLECLAVPKNVVRHPRILCAAAAALEVVAADEVRMPIVDVPKSWNVRRHCAAFVERRVGADSG